MSRVVPDEAGLTLVEVLVTVMVMGIAFTVLLGGMASSVLSSGMHEKQAKAEVEVRKYAESVKRASFDATGAYTGAYTPPAGFTASMPAPATCRNAYGATVACTTPNVVQILTVAVTVADGDVTETIQVAKRS